MLSGQGHGRRLHEGTGAARTSTASNGGSLHAHRAGSLPFRPVRPVPAPDPGRQRLRRNRDPFAHQPERLRRAGNPGQALRADRLARSAVRRPPGEAPADPPSVRRTPRRYGSGLRRIPGRSMPHARGDRGRARRTARGAAPVDGAHPRPVPAARRAPRPQPPPHRNRRRDLLPAEHVFQREPGAVPGRLTVPRRGSRTSPSGSGTPTPSTSAS